MSGDGGARARLRENPFHVLGLRPDASRAEVERAAQKLLAMLEVGLSAASHYPTPLGQVERRAEAVRRAAAELRDPGRRLLHELWAALPPEPIAGSEPGDGAASMGPIGDEPAVDREQQGGGEEEREGRPPGATPERLAPAPGLSAALGWRVR